MEGSAVPDYIYHASMHSGIGMHTRAWPCHVCVCVCARVCVCTCAHAHTHAHTHSYMPYVYKINFNECISDIGWFNTLTTPSVYAPINA